MMWLLLLTLTALFIGLHFVPFAPAVRARVVAAAGGENPYKGLYAIGSLVGLFGAFFAAAQVPAVVLWTTGDALRWLALALTLPAFVLLASAYVGTGGHRLARHPMLAGIGLWAFAHVLTTGDLGHLVVFGALAVYAPAAMLASDRRDAARDPEGFGRRARDLTPPLRDVRARGTDGPELARSARGPRDLARLPGAPRLALRRLAVAHGVALTRVVGPATAALLYGRRRRRFGRGGRARRNAAAVKRPPVGAS